MQFHSKIITLIVVFAFIDLNVANPIENRKQRSKHILKVFNQRSDRNAAKIDLNEIIKAAKLAQRQQPLIKRSVPLETEETFDTNVESKSDETGSVESNDPYYVDYFQPEQDSLIDYYNDDITTKKKVVVTTKKPVVTTKKPVVTTKKAVVTTKKAVVTTKKAVVTTKKPTNGGKNKEKFDFGTILIFTATTFWLATSGR